MVHRLNLLVIISVVVREYNIILMEKLAICSGLGSLVNSLASMGSQVSFQKTKNKFKWCIDESCLWLSVCLLENTILAICSKTLQVFFHALLESRLCSRQLRNQQWFSMVCTLVNNDICHHCGCNFMDLQGNKFWPLWWWILLTRPR